MINTLGFYTFVVFLGTHLVHDLGLSTPEWQAVWGAMLLTNVLATVLIGYVADRIGRVRTVAWFVPLSAILPAPAPHRVGAAVAIRNLGAGLSQFLGPVVAGLVAPIGVAGTLWVISGVSVAGTVLTRFLRTHDPRDAAGVSTPDRELTGRTAS
ncbi:hypothetical protein ACFWQL_26855 [Amycolatopsis thermoflava]|uniref:hypothetical protein n=1 Tax=Amycolatopsis thermoflava TaxID=84480 RepID=UPI00364A791D